MLPATVAASDLQKLFNVTAAGISQLASEGVVAPGKKNGQYLHGLGRCFLPTAFRRTQHLTIEAMRLSQ